MLPRHAVGAGGGVRQTACLNAVIGEKRGAGRILDGCGAARSRRSDLIYILQHYKCSLIVGVEGMALADVKGVGLCFCSSYCDDEESRDEE